MSASIDQIKAKLARWRARATALERRALANGGLLKRYERWQLEYMNDPYLLLSSDDYLGNRFIDHFHNNVRLSADGHLVPHDNFASDDGVLGPVFTHLQLEYRDRMGHPPGEVIAKAKDELSKYFRNERPTGVRLFSGFPERIGDVIVKFGREEHLSDMLRLGQIRLTPADYYSQGSLLKAMRDLETRRDFHIPAFNEVLNGDIAVSLDHVSIPIEDGFVKIVKTCPEYLLWCACQDIDRRMPDDFGANAALIIRDVDRFTGRLIAKVGKEFGPIATWHGPVSYYDPCSSTARATRPEQIKHFSFHYQKEWRFCVFPNDPELTRVPLFLYVGNLEDIAELVTLNGV